MDGVRQLGVEKRRVATPAEESLGSKHASDKRRYLALTNPLYVGGAPADRLETAGRILKEGKTSGMTG